MDTYEALAERMLASMDKHRHMPPEPVSSTIRGEMAVLHLLSQEGRGLNAGEIAGMLRMTTSRIAAVLNSLEKKGMILRLCDPADKRRVLVTLTSRGMAYCLEKRREAKAHMTRLLSRLTEEEAETFTRLAIKLFDFAPECRKDEEV